MKRFSFLPMLLIAFSLSILFSNCTRVDPTEAGFKISRSGSYRGVDSLPLETGWVFYWPFSTKVVTMPTTQQHIVWSQDTKEGSDANQEITISCLGGAGFKMDVGTNYHLDPFKASKIYLRFNNSDLSAISQTYLRNVYRGVMQDVSGTMTVDSLLNSLPLFESTVRQRIQEKLAPEGFVVELFNVLSQPRPSDQALASSINAKIKAKQDAERTKMELQSSIAEAEKQIASARGDSASKVIQASGEAEAIQKMREYLTPTYVEYLRAQKWNGALPTVSSGSGTSFLMQLPANK